MTRSLFLMNENLEKIQQLYWINKPHTFPLPMWLNVIIWQYIQACVTKKMSHVAGPSETQNVCSFGEEAELSRSSVRAEQRSSEKIFFITKSSE